MSGVDSCHSWVVAVASSLIFLLVSCPVRLGAQIFVSLLDYYDTSRKEASFPFVLAMVFRSISGPFAGALGEKIGLQGVTILGCLICSIGVGGCFFAEDVTVTTICLGVINGIGYGWSSALVPEILNRHFKKHRNKAYGIFLSGGGLGSIIIPLILAIILKQFGVSGTFLILAAVMLNSVPAAMLLIVPKREEKKTNSSLPLSIKVNNDIAENSQIAHDKALKAVARPESDGHNRQIDLIDNSRTSNTDLKRQLGIEEVVDNNEYCDADEKTSDKGCRTNECANSVAKHYPIQKSEASQCQLNKKQLPNDAAGEKNLKSSNEVHPPQMTLLSKFSVLWSPEYLIIALLHGIGISINQVFWTVMVDFVRDKGIDHTLEAYFVMSLALFDTIGRLFLNTIPDKGLMTVDKFCACINVTISLVILLLPWLPGFYSTITIISLMGFAFGGSTAIKPAIVTKFTMKEKRSIAMSSRHLFSAPFSLAMPPLIGFFRGSLGSYNGLLYLMAAMSAVSATLVLLLPVLKKRRENAQIIDKR